MKPKWKEARERTERTKRIEVCVSENEYSVIESRAKNLNMKVAPYLRKIGTLGEIIIFNVKELYALRNEIYKIGNNINQIAMVANSNKNISRNEIDKVLSNQIKIQNMLSEYFEILKTKAVKKCRSSNT